MGSHLPLRALAAFEAAARLGSFRAAAAELALTPSAVSHQIRQLEARLGLRLFDRVGRGARLSRDGEEAWPAVRDAFQALRQAAERLERHGTRARPADIVRIHTPPSFARCWMLPRLPHFLAAHPAIDIRVDAGPDRDLDWAAVDLAIVYGEAEHWSGRAEPLLDEAIQPLCAPGLAGAAAVRAPADLLALPLIRSDGNRLSWEDWFRRQGVAAVGIRAIRLDPSHVAIEAAVKGLGMVLESDLLTADEVAAGRLVAPLPGSAIRATGYWLAAPPGARRRAGVETVRDWLRASATPGPSTAGYPPAA